MLPFKNIEALAQSLYETRQTALAAVSLPTDDYPWSELGAAEQSVYLCMAGAATRHVRARRWLTVSRPASDDAPY